MTTLTHGDPSPGYGADADSITSPPWHGLLGQLERESIVFTGVQVLDPGPCTRCHPHEPAETGIVLVDYLDRHGRHQRRSCCRGCILAFLHDAVSDYTEILVYFRTRTPQPPEQVQVHEQVHAPSPAVSA